jgi:hypothetical protein
LASACGESGSQCISCGDNECIKGFCFRFGELPDAGDEGLGDGGTLFDGGSWTLDTLCTQALPSKCSYLTRCGRTETVPGCVDLLGPETALAGCGQNERAAVNGGRAAFDPAVAEACATYERQTASCGTAAPTLGPGCGQVLFGTVVDGSPCYDQFECAATSYCTADANTCPGVCAPKKPAGEAATTAIECQAGLYVYLGHCAQPMAPDASCAPASPTGLGGKLTCTDGTFCSALNVCTPNIAAGQACDAPAGQVCADGLLCVLRQCVGYLGAAAPCSGAASAVPCKLDLHCEGAQYHGPGTCQAAVGVDGGCFVSNDCTSAFFCNGAVLTQADGGSTRGVCTPLKPLGATCNISLFKQECQPGLYCGLGRTCVAMPGNGGVCGGTVCGAGLYCDAGNCAPVRCHPPL